MEINKIQQLIDQTEYWDIEILDLKISYFGDEVELIVDENEETCWKLLFLACNNVSYETDAFRRKKSNVKNMKKTQLGYYGQEISVKQSILSGFYSVDLDLSIMEMQIICRDIKVEKVSKKDIVFFWNNNVSDDSCS